MLLNGTDDVSASRKFYDERGLTMGKSFGSYVDFKMGSSLTGFGLYKVWRADADGLRPLVRRSP